MKKSEYEAIINQQSQTIARLTKEKRTLIQAIEEIEEFIKAATSVSDVYKDNR